MKLRLEVEVEVEDSYWNDCDLEEKIWFKNEVLGADPNSCDALILHSNLVGDEVGPVKVLDIEEIG